MKRIGCIGYATEQGLGRLAKSFWDAEVVTNMLIFQHPHYATHPEWYPPDTPVLSSRPFDMNSTVLKRFLSEIDVLLCFETPFCWTLIDACRKIGVKTVIVPMYEWTPECLPARFDQWLCPSLLDLEYFKNMPLAEFIPIPVDMGIAWQQRTTAKRFLHNAGHIGCRGHKGTLELLKAVQHVRSPLSLTITCQDANGLSRLINQVPDVKGDTRVKFVVGDLPRHVLFDGEHDVYVAPEKFNGLSLPLQEAYASGMVVITTDRFPTNTWLTHGLIPVSGYSRARTQPSNLEIDEATIDPSSIAKVMDEWYNRDIANISLSGKVWAEKHSWQVLKSRWLEALNR
jgi:glycosyltransferase involved in cell wall biosynthesis